MKSPSYFGPPKSNLYLGNLKGFIFVRNKGQSSHPIDLLRFFCTWSQGCLG
eukprot:m.70331 g.70331  ORF g.70331 m.70331 type:complete len:51 (-) comp24211_c1_seq1:1566-1718(-)